MPSNGYGDFFQGRYSRITKDIPILAATDYSAGNGTSVVSVKNVNYTLFIQRIVFSPTTYAAKTFTFQDNAGTPVPIGFMSIPAAAPTTGSDQDQFNLDYGPTGVALTEGVDLLMKMSATGAAGILHIEGYVKQTKTMGSYTGASLQ